MGELKRRNPFQRPHQQDRPVLATRGERKKERKRGGIGDVFRTTDGRLVQINPSVERSKFWLRRFSVPFVFLLLRSIKTTPKCREPEAYRSGLCVCARIRGAPVWPRAAASAVKERYEVGVNKLPARVFYLINGFRGKSQPP